MISAVTDTAAVMVHVIYQFACVGTVKTAESKGMWILNLIIILGQTVFQDNVYR